MRTAAQQNGERSFRARSRSFAECVVPPVGSARRYSVQLPRSASRQEWLFHKSGAVGYIEALKPFTEDPDGGGGGGVGTPVSVPRGSDGSFSLEVGAAIKDGVDIRRDSVSTPSGTPAVLNKSPLEWVMSQPDAPSTLLSPVTEPEAQRPEEMPEPNTMVLSPWHGLVDAPLYHDTLGDPLFLFDSLLRQLQADNPAGPADTYRDELTRSVVILVHTCETALTRPGQVGRSHHHPAQYVKKCNIVVSAACAGGYSAGAFTPHPLGEDAVVAITEVFAAMVDVEHVPMHQQRVFLEKKTRRKKKESNRGSFSPSRGSRRRRQDKEEACSPHHVVTKETETLQGLSSFRVHKVPSMLPSRASSIQTPAGSLRLRQSSLSPRHPLHRGTGTHGSPVAASLDPGHRNMVPPQMPSHLSLPSDLCDNCTATDGDGSSDENDEASIGPNERASRKAGSPKEVKLPQLDNTVTGGQKEGNEEAFSPASSMSYLPCRDPTNFYDVSGMSKTETLKADVWDVLRHPDSGDRSSPRFFAAVVQGVVLVAWAVVFAIKSFPEYHRISGPQFAAFNALDIFFAAFYTCEYCLRLFCSPHRKSSVLQPLQLCLLLSLLPFYIRLGHRLGGGDYWVVTGFMGHIEMVTVFRVMKATMYMGENLSRLSKVIEASRWMLLIGAVALAVFIVTISNALYYAELFVSGDTYDYDANNTVWRRSVEPQLVRNGTLVQQYEESPIQSQLDVFWWCISTVTTVGYGDVTPITPAGKVVAGLCIVMGVLVFAVPASVICSHFTLTKSDHLLEVEYQQKHRVRSYIKYICTKSFAADPDVPIFLYHFVMLDTVEADYNKNPTSEDITSRIYRKVLLLYRVARKSERLLIQDLKRAESGLAVDDPLGDIHMTMGQKLKAELPAAQAFSAASDPASRKEAARHIMRQCQKQFMNTCAEVFREEKERLWGAYAKLKHQEIVTAGGTH